MFFKFKSGHSALRRQEEEKQCLISKYSATFTAAIKLERNERGNRFVCECAMWASLKLLTDGTCPAVMKPTMAILTTHSHTHSNRHTHTHTRTGWCLVFNPQQCFSRAPCQRATHLLRGFSKNRVRTNSTVHLVPKRPRREWPDPPTGSPWPRCRRVRRAWGGLEV